MNEGSALTSQQMDAGLDSSEREVIHDCQCHVVEHPASSWMLLSPLLVPNSKMDK